MTILLHFLVWVPGKLNLSFSLYSPCAHGSYKGLMSNFNSLFWTSSIGLSKTHSIIYYECLIREESMTKNGDFGQNRQNRSTSNAYRIAGTHKWFRFFSLKTYIYHSWTTKTPYGRFLPGTIPTKNSQVTIAKWSQSMPVPEGPKPWKSFHLKIV